MPPWEPDSPVMLGRGILVCRAHQQIVCGQCCVDYSFMSELENSDLEEMGEEESDEDEDNAESEHGLAESIGLTMVSEDTGEDTSSHHRILGSFIVPNIRRFEPPTPTTTPQQLFPLQHLWNRQGPRFVHRSDNNSFLIYTDGACLNNGHPRASAGWSFVFRLPEANQPKIGSVAHRLEDQGPSRETHPQTSNRAELRAVIAALQFRAWFSEGWRRLVIATDSEYVTKGATEWVHPWVRNDWVTSKQSAVKNRDLWETLLGEVIRYARNGMQVCFWRIPRG